MDAVSGSPSLIDSWKERISCTPEMYPTSTPNKAPPRAVNAAVRVAIEID
jgi:hypothetical protein